MTSRREPKVTDDFIKCEICKQKLTNPKTLDCLHSFCRDCILNYIVQTIGKSAASQKYIQCPLCLKTTEAPNPNNPTEEWADDFTVDTFVFGYMEALDLKDIGKPCDTCFRQEKSAEAEKWCSSCHDALCGECVNFHNALTTTTNHKLTELSKLRRQPLKDIIVPPSCTEHGGEILDKYCEDHKVVICEKCIASKHKDCKDITTTKEAVQKHKAESSHTHDMLSEESRLAKAIYDDRSKADDILDEDQAKALEKIQAVRKNVEDVLAKCEAEIIGELYDIQSKEKTDIQAEMKEAQRLRKSSNKVLGYVENANRYGSEAHVLLAAPKVTNEANYYEGRLLSLNSRINTTNIDFIVESTIQKVTTSVKELGNLQVKQTKAELPVHAPLRTDRPSYKDNGQEKKGPLKKEEKAREPAEMIAAFSGRTSSDWEVCWFTGVAYLPDESILLIDRNNSKIKIFDKTFQPVSETTLEHQPFDVAVLAPTEIAVTLPRENKIELFTIGAKVTHRAFIETSDRCYGISFARDRFAVACSCGSPPSIKVISIEGEELLDICPEDTATYHPMFFRPWYVKLDEAGNNFFVSDCNRSHLTCVTRSVIKRYMYKSNALNSPRGVFVTFDGKVLVCGWGSDNVQLINEKGEWQKDILTRNDGIIGPQNVALSPMQDKMLVTFDPSSGYSHSVRLYKFSKK